MRQVTLKTGQQVADEAVRQIDDFQKGRVQPITTGTPHLDTALLGGLLPGTVLTMAGYSFHGKSYELEKVQRHISKTHVDVIMLNCAWELEGFKIISRDLAYRTKKSVKEVLFNEPRGEDINVFNNTIDSYRRNGLWFQPEPVNSDQFENDVMWLIEAYPQNRIVVCIDNLENILVDKGNQKECMDRMLYRINVLKKRHSFISFIVLNQLNNDILARVDNLKGHPPIQKDLYGTGQLFKLSDVVMIKVMPTRFGLQDKFMIFGTKMYPHLETFKLPSRGKTTSFDPFGNIFYFYLKARETDISFHTVYADKMYTREDVGLPPLEDADIPVFPVVDKTKIEIPVVEPMKFNTPAIKSARGEGFDDDVPF